MKKLTTGDPETRSADVLTDNIIRLKELFPEAFTESKVDFEVLKAVLGGAVDEREEKYGLSWHGKRRARQLALTPSTGTLRPCPGDSLEWDSTKNLMIEGDNLEVLKLLEKSYAGRVRLVYIDPPYNTGGDFVYSDDFQDNIKNYLELTGQLAGDRRITTNTESGGRFHTAWLNMMYPRVRLGRTLLREDGIMLISIDDHEVNNLRGICNEVFGEENFIATMVWEKGRKNDAKLVSVGHEYVLVYARSLGVLRETKTIWREEKPGAREIWQQYITLRSQHGDDNALIELHMQAWFASLPKAHPSRKWSRYKRVDSHGPWRDRDISWPGGGGPRYNVIHPVTKLPCKVPDSGWRFEETEMLRQIALGLVEFRKDHTEPPFRKAHIRPFAAEVETDGEPEGETSSEDGEDELANQVRGSCLYKQSQVAVKYLRSLLGGNVFNNPKDHVELARLFDYVTSNDKSAIIVDFFAGSGSTGQAVMELNSADGGSRRFVLVQLPEPLDPEHKDQKAAAKYCDQIGKPRTIAELTKERLRRAAARVGSEPTKAPVDLGFRTFRLDSSNIRVWEPDRDNLPKTLEESIDHLKADRTEADILYELLLKLGLDLCVPIEQRSVAGKTIHSIGGGVLFACLAEKIPQQDVEPLAQGIVSWRTSLSPAGDSSCVFRDSAFVDDVAKTNIAAILSQHGISNIRSL